MTIRTVAASGADYTTVQAAVNACDLATMQTVMITDSAQYDEDVDCTGMTGSGTEGSHLVLTADTDVRHAGVEGTGHARIGNNGGHCIELGESWTVVEFLEIVQDANTNSAEGIRIGTGLTGVQINNCIIHNTNDAGDKDGIYFAPADGDASDITVENCVIYGFDRGGINCQNYSSGFGATTLELNITNCTIHDCGDTSEVEGGGVTIRTDSTSFTVTLNVYNNVITGSNGTASQEDDIVCTDTATTRRSAVGTVNINGSNNVLQTTIDSADTDITDNTTGEVLAGNGMTATTTATDSVIVANITGGSEDFTLVEATGAGVNDAWAAGTDRSEQLPHPGSKLGIDIAGMVRPTTNVDCGAHQASNLGVLRSVVFGHTEDGSTGTFDIAEPAGTVDGDLLIFASVMQDWSGTSGVTEDTTTDWTLVSGADANNQSCDVFKVERGASSPGLTFTRSGGTAYGPVAFGVYRLVGADATTVAAAISQDTDFSSPASPSTATTVADEIGILFGGLGGSSEYSVPAAGVAILGSGLLHADQELGWISGWDIPGAGTWDPGDYTHDGGLVYSATITVEKSTTVTIVQEGYRWRTDSGNEATATWEAAQDTDITAPGDVTIGVRVVVDYTGDPPTGKPKLQHREVGGSAWFDVPLEDA